MTPIQQQQHGAHSSDPTNAARSSASPPSAHTTSSYSQASGKSTLSSLSCCSPIYSCFRWICGLLRSLWNALCCCFISARQTTNTTQTAASQNASSPQVQPSQMQPVENVKTSTRTLLPPVGIERIGYSSDGPIPTNNCCFIVLIQGFVHIPSWRKLAEEMPVLQDMVNEYESGQAKRWPLCWQRPQALRDCCCQLDIDMQKKRASEEDPIRSKWEGDAQEDPADILDFIVQRIVGLEEVHPPLYILSRGGIDQKVSGRLCQTLCPDEGDRRATFAELVDRSFVEKSTALQFLEQPPELLFNVSRVMHDTQGNCSKNTNPLPGEVATFDLPAKYVSGGDAAKPYFCDYFIVHEGSANSGHYYCGVKVGEQWYKCDDTKVTPITEESAVRLMRLSSMLHYSLKK